MYYEAKQTRMTMGAYFTSKEFIINNEAFLVAVWDTAGEKKFRSMTEIYCAIIMYDIAVTATHVNCNRPGCSL